MEKLSINKLIANDIINCGMDQTSSFNYTVSLNEYLDSFDDESQVYILKNLDKIIEDIKNNENVADLIVEEDDKDKGFNMVFYFDNLMSELDKVVYKNAELLGKELELEDIRSISQSVLGDDAFNDDIVSKIKNSRGCDLDI